MVFETHALGRVASGHGTLTDARIATTASGTPATAPAPKPLPHIEGLVRADGLVDYRAGLRLQEALRDEVVAGERAATLLLLEHPPVYTAGRTAEPSEYPYDGTEVVAIDRGGRVTWHGPGQLIAYFIGQLRKPINASGLVRSIEAAIVETLAEVGVAAEAVSGRPGVWCAPDARGPARKIAAIGLSIRRGSTMHGLALTCTSDLRDFGRIVPCGINDAGVTSVANEGVAGVTPATIAPLLTAALNRHVAVRFEETLGASVQAAAQPTAAGEVAA